jgi:hypothetical protein
MNIQVLRVQSSEGTKRIDITSQDTYKKLYDKVINKTNIFNS